MPLSLLLSLAIRNLARHRIRTLITILALVFGVSGIIFTRGFFASCYQQLRTHIIGSQTGHLQIIRRDADRNQLIDPTATLINHPDKIMAMINSITGIKKISPQIQTAGLLTDGQDSVSCFIFGKDIGYPDGALLATGLADIMERSAGDDVILLSRTLDESINGMDIKIHREFESPLPQLNDLAIQIPLVSAQSLLRTDAVHSLVIYLDETNQTDMVKSQIESILSQNHPGLTVKAWYEINDYYDKTKELFEGWYNVVNLVMVMIMVLIVYNTMNMIVAERTIEIGTIRAVGSRQNRIVHIILTEGILLGFVGGLVGVAIGSLITYMVGVIGIPMPRTPGMAIGWIARPLVVGSTLLTSIFLATITAAISSFIPAWQASRLDIAQSLRHAT